MNIQEFYDLFDELARKHFVLSTFICDFRDILAKNLLERGVLQPVPLGISVGDKIEMKGT